MAETMAFDLHVLGMPPAFVLSQNQTLKLMYDRAPEEYPKQDRHLWEPFLHKITIGVFAIRTFGTA